jgi:hypothetical protein
MAADQNRSPAEIVTTAHPLAFSKISTMMSDVDGSSLTNEKVLTAGVRVAVAQPYAASADP